MSGRRRWFRPGVGVLAAGAGLASAVALSSASAATPTPVVQAYTVPSGTYSSPVASYLEPIAPDPDGTGDLFIVNDTGVHDSEIYKEPLAGGTPSFLRSIGEPAFTVSFAALVPDEGSDWGLSEDAVYGGIGPSGGGTINANENEPTDVHDMTVGSGNDLYWTDNAGFINQEILGGGAAGGAAEPGMQYAVPSGVEPDAITYAGGKLWFTDDNAQLYSLDPTGAGTFSGPYGGQASQYAHTLAADTSGDVWAVGGGVSAAGGDEILEIDSSNGTTAHTYTSGLPTTPGITSLTVGPDGNIWFTETHAEEIGELDVSTGQISNYPVPSGFELPAAGSDVIAAGPAGCGELFFGAETTPGTNNPTGAPAIGVIAGLDGTTGGCTATTTTTTTATSTTTTTTTTSTTTATPPGTPKVSGTAAVSAKDVASVPVSCTGPTGAVCSGSVTLYHSVKKTIKGTRKTHTKTVTTTLGSAKYRLAAGTSAKLSVKLNTAAAKLLTAAHNHRLKVTETVKPAGGKASTHTLTLVGPTTKSKK